MTHSMFTDVLAETHRHDLLADAARQRLKHAVHGGGRRRTGLLTAVRHVLASGVGRSRVVAGGLGDAQAQSGAGSTAVEAAVVSGRIGLENPGRSHHLKEVTCAEY